MRFVTYYLSHNDSKVSVGNNQSHGKQNTETLGLAIFWVGYKIVENIISYIKTHTARITFKLNAKTENSPYCNKHTIHNCYPSNVNLYRYFCAFRTCFP